MKSYIKSGAHLQEFSNSKYSSISNQVLLIDQSYFFNEDGGQKNF